MQNHTTLTNGCKCQSCGKTYKVDLNIPDNLWKQITQNNKSEKINLLCGSCIMKLIERVSDFSAWELKQI